jgi:uroporphyrinogen III methyltransferase/synthase
VSGTGPAARPLDGRRVLVTRPRAQAQALVEQLEAAGAEAIVAPAIRIVPPEDRGPLLRAAADCARFDWIVVTSSNAVDAFADAVAESNGRIAPETRVCAVGTRTAARLRERGIPVTLVPDEFRAEALVAAMATSTPLAGATVLLPRSEIAREIVADGLRAAGADVTDVVAYRTIPDDADAGELDVRQQLVAGRLDAVTFTSGSAVRAFVQMVGPHAAEPLRRTVVTVIGPVTGDVARALGIRVDVQPVSYTTEAMVTALAEHFAESRTVEGRENHRIR